MLRYMIIFILILIPATTWADGMSKATELVNRFSMEQENILEEIITQKPGQGAKLIKEVLISIKSQQTDLLEKIKSVRWSETSISKQTGKVRDMFALYTFTYISQLNDIVGRLPTESRRRIEFAIDKSRKDRGNVLETLDMIYENERNLETDVMKKWYPSTPVSKVPTEAKGLMNR